MMKRIERRTVPAMPSGLPGDLHPVLARVYAARQVGNALELERTLERLPPLALLHGLDAAVARLAQAIEARRRIMIVGDFDADGATSTAVAVRALRAMGAADVRFLVPNRFEYGYGLTPEIVALALQQTPDVIVTVDNGISSIEGVTAAKRAGVQVIVTDHHLPGAQLPDADAIVNPNQPGDVFPSKCLAGVGVIFYVMLALRAALRDDGWFAHRSLEAPNLAELLDLVALGTVADVVPLDHANRILVAQGLARIRRGRCCAGIAALLEVGGRQRERVVAADLGFIIGPRLNAAGRLEDMTIGIQCLLSDDPATARRWAQELDALNRERRAIEHDMQQQALAHLEAVQDELGDALPTGLCLFHDDWHQGVIGILASRIKERYNRPVIAFADAGNGDIKGSARSVPGFHIRDALDAIAARHPGLLTKFGGHAMAAGMTLKRARYDDFQAAFDEEARRHLGPDDLQGVVWSDGELGPQDLTLELAEALRHGGPWGQGFPEPAFDGCFDIVERRIVGERHLKLRLRPAGTQAVIEAIAFHAAEAPWAETATRLRAAYRLDVNEYRGLRSPQLIVEYAEGA